MAWRAETYLLDGVVLHLLVPVQGIIDLVRKHVVAARHHLLDCFALMRAHFATEF